MFRRSRTQAIKDNAASGRELAMALARDKKFREQLAAAIAHGAAARRRAAHRFGLMAAAARLAADEELRRELAATIEALQEARRRGEKKRSHTVRNMLLVVGGSAGAFALYKLRSKLPLGRGSEGTETVAPEQPAEPVPASTAETQA
jgi:plasmid stabilization system protein ParE